MKLALAMISWILHQKNRGPKKKIKSKSKSKSNQNFKKIKKHFCLTKDYQKSEKEIHRTRENICKSYT